MSAVEKQFQDAIKAMNSGKPLEAERLFKNILRTHSKNVAALNLLTVVLMSMERHAEAENFISKAVKLNQRSDVSYYNYGLISKKLGKPQQALEQFSNALRLNSKVPETWNNRGTAFNDLKQCETAISDFDQAILLAPNYSSAFCNKGKSLTELKRYDEAFAAYDKALAFKPDLAEAWLGHGNVFHRLKRHGEALAAYDRAQSIKPDIEAAWVGRGHVLYDLKRYDEAFAAYDKALAFEPDLAEAWLGRGNVFNHLKRCDEAFAAYDKALAFKPDLAEAWLGRGNVFNHLKRYDEAFAAYDKALAFKPDLAEVWLSRGHLFHQLRRYGEALAAYDEALALKPDLGGTEGIRLHTKMHLCDWTLFDAESANLITSAKDKKPIASAFALLGISSSSDDQLQYAKVWVTENCPPSKTMIWQGERYKHDRIRVAYVSADFRQHATSYLMAGMLECHNKSRLEVTAISIGPDDESEIRQRLKRSFDVFINANARSDEEIASLIRKAEIDILIDLKGFTQDARTGILARRPAPIQVNYLGYPGTMAASYIDYIVADHTVIPNEDRKFYSEKVVVLPNTYQVNDRNRVISDTAFSRPDFRLPSEGFVFCCFNNNYKITPHIFNCWMRILKRVNGSVLWLLEDNATAVDNLRKEAGRQGVSLERLVFAKRMPLPDHLARHKLADLFLDTLPCNAHTTASDALWAGLPVLTRLGETFAGRVAASLLNAIGLPELITKTPEAYERMAIELATYPEKMAIIKAKLADNRLTKPLFDTQLFTKNIEAAYTAMYERYQVGLAPDHIVVPN
jgi:protein O-GlcNAc transferase